MTNRLCAGVAVLVTALALPAASQSKVRENTKCTPNPAFEKFPSSVYHSCERSRFSTLELHQAKAPAKIGGAYEKFTKEGVEMVLR